jgi:hypothetical protein
MSERQPKGAARQSTVVQASVILKPRRMRGVLVQILRTDVVVLALAHAPEAS